MQKGDMGQLFKTSIFSDRDDKIHNVKFQIGERIFTLQHEGADLKYAKFVEHQLISALEHLRLLSIGEYKEYKDK